MKVPKPTCTMGLRARRIHAVSNFATGSEAHRTIVRGILVKAVRIVKILARTTIAVLVATLVDIC